MNCEELLKRLRQNLEIMRDSSDIIREEAFNLANHSLLRAIGFNDEFILRSDPIKISRRIIDFINMFKFEARGYYLCLEDTCFNYFRFFNALNNYIISQKEVRRDLKFVDICK